MQFSSPCCILCSDEMSSCSTGTPGPPELCFPSWSPGLDVVEVFCVSLRPRVLRLSGIPPHIWRGAPREFLLGRATPLRSSCFLSPPLPLPFEGCFDDCGEGEVRKTQCSPNHLDIKLLAAPLCYCLHYSALLSFVWLVEKVKQSRVYLEDSHVQE